MVSRQRKCQIKTRELTVRSIIDKFVKNSTELKEVNLKRNTICVYFLYSSENTVYIGRTKCLMSRLSTHTWEGKEFDKISYIEVLEEESGAIETVYINMYKPLYNVKSANADVSKHILNLYKDIIEDYGSDLINKLS